MQSITILNHNDIKNPCKTQDLLCCVCPVLKWYGEVFCSLKWNGSKLFLFLEILHLLVGIWDDRVCSGLPASRADLSVLVSVLESLNQPKGFVYGPSHGEIVHGDLSENSLVINDEQSSKGVAIVLQIDSVV